MKNYESLLIITNYIMKMLISDNTYGNINLYEQ